MTIEMRDLIIKQEAYEKGYAEERAKAQHEYLIEVALRMIKADFSLEIISKMTELPYDEVYKLKENAGALQPV